MSHVIDARLRKVVDFGDRAGEVRPLTLRDRGAYHLAELVARAAWARGGDVKVLPPDEHHRRPRWCLMLNGAFQRGIDDVKLIPSDEGPGISMVIVVRKPNFGRDIGWTDVPYSTM